jgi:glycosyltransferase involved in cell wall biosynthesis
MAHNGRTLFFDIGDTVNYLSHHSSVSGIQRVVIEIWKGLQVNNAFTTRPIFFDHSQNSFLALNPSNWNELIQMLEGSSSEFDITGFASSPNFKSSGENLEACLSKGDVILVLGASWTYQQFFVELNRLKGLGLSIISLVYDLIPIVTPSFPQESKVEFTRGLIQLLSVSDCVATISQSTRIDLDEFAKSENLVSPKGPVTKLPGGFSGKKANKSELNKFQHKSYILMVGTIEERKNHLVVLRAYVKTLASVGASNTPDLIIVGRLGWNINGFIDEFKTKLKLEERSKVTLLTHNVDDQTLAELYAGALFTIYPSKYEGWGLPVSESLDFGVPVITSTTSSLPEAGEDYAIYVDPNDIDQLSDAMIKWITDPSALLQNRSMLRSRQAVTISDVVNLLKVEAEAIKPSVSFVPQLEIGFEYGFGNFVAIKNLVNGAAYLRNIESRRSLPMTNQISKLKNSSLASFLLNGPDQTKDEVGETFRSKTDDLKVTMKFRRTSNKELIIHVAVKSPEKKLRVQIINSDGIFEEIFTCGGVISTKLSPRSYNSEESIEYIFHKVSNDQTDTLTATFCSVLASEQDFITGELDILKVQYRTHLQFCEAQNGVYEQMLQQGNRINALESSISWRITTPLRAAGEILRIVLRNLNLKK